MQRLLEEEIGYYEENLEDLENNHADHFVLIKGRELVAVGKEEEKVVAEGIRRYGQGPFLVRKVGEHTKVLNFPRLAIGMELAAAHGA